MSHPSAENGGHGLGLSGEDGDRAILEAKCMWQSAADGTINRMPKELTDWAEKESDQWQQKGLVLH